MFKNSELGAPVTKGVEMINYAPHPVVEDVRPLLGGVALPFLAGELEYDAALPEAAHEAFRRCVAALAAYPDLLRGPVAGMGELIKALVGWLSADPHLPQIYAGTRRRTPPTCAASSAKAHAGRKVAFRYAKDDSPNQRMGARFLRGRTGNWDAAPWRYRGWLAFPTKMQAAPMVHFQPTWAARTGQRNGPGTSNPGDPVRKVAPACAVRSKNE